MTFPRKEVVKVCLPKRSCFIGPVVDSVGEAGLEKEDLIESPLESVRRKPTKRTDKRGGQKKENGRRRISTRRSVDIQDFFQVRKGVKKDRRFGMGNSIHTRHSNTVQNQRGGRGTRREAVHIDAREEEDAIQEFSIGSNNVDSDQRDKGNGSRRSHAKEVEQNLTENGRKERTILPSHKGIRRKRRRVAHMPAGSISPRAGVSGDNSKATNVRRDGTQNSTFGDVFSHCPPLTILTDNGDDIVTSTANQDRGNKGNSLQKGNQSRPNQAGLERSKPSARSRAEVNPKIRKSQNAVDHEDIIIPETELRETEQADCDKDIGNIDHHESGRRPAGGATQSTFGDVFSHCPPLTILTDNGEDFTTPKRDGGNKQRSSKTKGTAPERAGNNKSRLRESHDACDLSNVIIPETKIPETELPETEQGDCDDIIRGPEHDLENGTRGASEAILSQHGKNSTVDIFSACEPLTILSQDPWAGHDEGEVRNGLGVSGNQGGGESLERGGGESRDVGNGGLREEGLAGTERSMTQHPTQRRKKEIRRRRRDIVNNGMGKRPAVGLVQGSRNASIVLDIDNNSGVLAGGDNNTFVGTPPNEDVEGTGDNRTIAGDNAETNDVDEEISVNNEERNVDGGDESEVKGVPLPRILTATTLDTDLIHVSDDIPDSLEVRRYSNPVVTNSVRKATRLAQSSRTPYGTASFTYRGEDPVISCLRKSGLMKTTPYIPPAPPPPPEVADPIETPIKTQVVKSRKHTSESSASTLPPASVESSVKMFESDEEDGRIGDFDREWRTSPQQRQQITMTFQAPPVRLVFSDSEEERDIIGGSINDKSK